MFGKQDKPSEVKSSSTSTGDMNGFIGKGMKAEGKLSFEGVVRIEGVFKGEVTSAGTLIVGEGGQLEGNITVDTAIISGEVKGLINAKTRVELNAPAKVYGDIKTPNLIICEGVLFEGNCIMSGKSGPVVKPSFGNVGEPNQVEADAADSEKASAGSSEG